MQDADTSTTSDTPKLDLCWELTVPDLVAASFALLAWRPFLLFIALGWPLNVCLSLLDLAKGQGLSARSAVVLFMVPLMILFIYIAARRQGRRLSSEQRTVSCTLSRDGVDMRGDRFTRSVTYRECRGWGQNRAIFGLVLPEGGLFAMPKRALDEATRRQVEQLLRSAVFKSGRRAGDRRKRAWMLAGGGWLLICAVIAWNWYQVIPSPR